eukprot:TRINITY_DN25642_c0_g4_i2.p1 TRINITY_DN25642_c0_g4~~TRINITY_DN25642_c0_g4_i2.p1  ORF type:complete len:110 (+),score=10.05 TRINITY_DN25642_c0_g4_i2:117-446(+)
MCIRDRCKGLLTWHSGRSLVGLVGGEHILIVKHAEGLEDIGAVIRVEIVLASELVESDNAVEGVLLLYKHNMGEHHNVELLGEGRELLNIDVHEAGLEVLLGKIAEVVV